MKKTMIAIAVLLMVTTSTFAQAMQDTTHKKHHTGTMAKKYTCPMHPEVVADKPGKCPKCGMDLVAVKKKAGKKQKPAKDMTM